MAFDHAEFFKLMNEIENEDLVFTLETIVDKFGEEMAPYAFGLCQNLVYHFLDALLHTFCTSILYKSNNDVEANCLRNIDSQKYWFISSLEFTRGLIESRGKKRAIYFVTRIS